MTSAYRFSDHVYAPDDPRWPELLRKAYEAQLRPACQCRPEAEGLDTYVSLLRGQYVLRRMPNTGSRHAPHCEHYEPPPELSGFGQVQGCAIVEDTQTQVTSLSLDFPLTKGRSRTVNATGELEHESVRSTGTKLTLRALLHFLMDDAGLTRWTPAMAGRRSWFVVRRELLEAASSKRAKGEALSALLYIPETFSLDRADDIRRRQQASLSRLAESTSHRMLLIAEVKAIEDARFGKRLILKHMPDSPLMLTDALHKHLAARFAPQLQLWGRVDSSHLLMIATISRSSQGLLCAEAACLLNVNEHWLPFESLHECELMAALHTTARRFTKALRYNLPSAKPVATLVLQDTGAVPTALFVVPQGLEVPYDAAIHDLATAQTIDVWRWQPETEPLPPLPLAQQNAPQDGRSHRPPEGEHPRPHASPQHSQ